tara:strand:+ start:10995 stop:11375 length:381 start_codon:yes stop_codon:yes gene_type:complete
MLSFLVRCLLANPQHDQLPSIQSREAVGFVASRKGAYSDASSYIDTPALRRTAPRLGRAAAALTASPRAGAPGKRRLAAPDGTKAAGNGGDTGAHEVHGALISDGHRQAALVSPHPRITEASGACA